MTESAFIELDQDSAFWARKYCEKGLRVIPLHTIKDLKTGECTCKKGLECGRNAGKHPVYAAWASKASNDFALMEGEFRGARNIGIACGQGVVAIDIDGDDGRRSLRQLVVDHPGDWPEGPVAETGSGNGLHFLFKTREAFKNSVRIVDGIDVRSDGGQIAACPSMHKSGRRYKWLPLADGTSSFDLPIPDLPEWLAAILRGTARLDFDIVGWLAEQPPAVSGENGSAHLMRVTHKLVRAGLCRTFQRFETVIAPWNATCEPPWSDRELEHAFDNAMSKFSTEAAIELPMDKNGQVICSRVHVDQIVRADPRYEGQFRFNKRAMECVYRDAPLTDAEMTRIEVEICGRYRLRSVSPLWLRESIAAVADEASYDPVVDYLKGLRWDGVRRIAQVPGDLLFCKPSPLFASVFRRWMIGAARRALEPGCQMDNVLILHGPQGYRKTSFFRAMGGKHHIDAGAVNLSDKDIFLKLHRSWILEWSELSSITRLEQERVKGFITTTIDDFRPPYGHMNISKPRAAVVVGTTQQKQFLIDPTGSRRYWIIPVEKKIDIDGVIAARDQLWAEAVAAVAHEQHFLTEEEDAARAEASAEFTQVDAIYQAAQDILEFLPTDRISWRQLCVMIDVKPDVSGRPRESISGALLDCGFRSERVAVELPGGKQGRQSMWVRRSRPSLSGN